MASYLQNQKKMSDNPCWHRAQKISNFLSSEFFHNPKKLRFLPSMEALLQFAEVHRQILPSLEQSVLRKESPDTFESQLAKVHRRQKHRPKVNFNILSFFSTL